MRLIHLISLRQFSKLFMLCITLFFLVQCKEKKLNILKQETGTINGKIINYDGVVKSGKLSYFDAISRTIDVNEIFAIDSTGSFKLTFNISHPIYQIATLMIQGHYFSPFLEPGKNLQIQINGKSIKYLRGYWTNKQTNIPIGGYY